MRRTAPCAAVLLSALVALASAVPGQPQPAPDRVREVLEEVRREHELPAVGAVVVRGDGAPAVTVIGTRKRGTDAAAAAGDLWHLGSNSKPITALLFAILVDLGLIDWETPLADVFPELAQEWDDGLKKTTPVHLLTHTSGLPANWPGGWFSIPREGSPADQRLVMMKKLGTAERQAAGEEYLYSNLGYTVLGAVIDRVGKSPWEDQVQKRVFEPLKIRTAGFGPVRDDGLSQPWPHGVDGDPVRPGGVLDNPPVMNPAGRVHMSLADYGRYLAETLKLARGGKGLVEATTAEKIFADSPAAGPHCLAGWVRFGAGEQLAFDHNGSNTMNYFTAVVLPGRDLAVGVATNRGGDAGRDAVLQARRRLVEAARE